MIAASLTHRRLFQDSILLVAKIGQRLFSRDELRQAYLKLSDPNIVLHGRAGRLAFFLMRVLRKIGLIHAFMNTYMQRVHRNLVLNVYDRGFLNLTLNRIYDMPDVT